MKSRLKDSGVNLLMISDITQSLLTMRARDEEKRAALAATGTLFDGYHPEMEEIHLQNAQALRGIIDDLGGWPHAGLVGREGSEAAWLIAQHAISLPDFQRHVLTLLHNSSPDQVSPRHLAHLEDRILCFEGKPQKYGTQFDWDDCGQLNPKPIADIEHVDILRAQVGLPPLAIALAEIRERSAAEGEKAPADFKERQKSFDVWARKVGWR